jgi:malic enzyme
VALAGILAGLRVTGEPLTRQRILFVGAGAAATGIARLVRQAAGEAGSSGPSGDLAMAMVDTKGLVHLERPGIEESKHEFALGREALASLDLTEEATRDLVAIVDRFRPTILIGTSAAPGAFSEPMIRAMAAHAPRPIILPLSNPTAQCEAVPADLLAWTAGRAIVAAGSPFEPVAIDGRLHLIAQANNALVFPGIGLGAIVAEATTLSDGMFLAAARVLASMVSDDRLASGAVYPPIADLRGVSRAIAAAVVREARDAGVGRWIDDADVEAVVGRAMWYPAYVRYVPV